MYPLVSDGQVVEYTLFEIIANLGISIRIDILSYCLALISSFVWMLVTIYSTDYMAHEHAGNRYYPVLIVTWAAAWASSWRETSSPSSSSLN
jgi:formate hydrogenlyase subunit 3/multisubunit Na+/H+ antiporter MnhD subunit